MGTCSALTFKQQSCSVFNMAWFDWLEELGIVNEANGTIKGCLDEWVDGI